MAEKVIKKRKVSHAGCRTKGRNCEVEIVKILDEAGIPSQRVLGSGAFAFAKSDIKLGINLNDDGTKPPPDETPCKMRLESKNHASTPDRLFEGITGEIKIAALLAVSTSASPEAVFKHLEQDKVSKAVVLRRAKVPTGALAKKDYNSTHVVCMGMNDWIELIKLAYYR